MWQIEFTSDRFLPALPEESQVNPGVYGFELSYWLAHSLLKRGIVASYPECEDWGWFIELTNAEGNEFMIGCSSMAEPEEGYKGAPIDWSIFVKPYLSLADRLKGSYRLEQLGQHIIAALTEERIEVE